MRIKSFIKKSIADEYMTSFSSIGYKIDSVVKIPENFRTEVGGIEMRINDCKGLIMKDIHTKIKKGDMYPSDIIGLREQESYTLGVKVQGDNYFVQIPLQGKKYSN